MTPFNSLTPDQTILPTSAGIGQTPNPWFTVANQFVPRNLHDVIRWARYITFQSPVTTEVIRKYATYPITDFLVDTRNEALKTTYKKIFKSFKMKQTLQDVGFEHFTIGNVFTSVFFPVLRTLICPHCKSNFNAKKSTFLTFKNYGFWGTCPKCSKHGQFSVIDNKSIDVDEMNIIKWDPEHIAVNHNPITGESEYYYKIPNTVKARIRKGDLLFANSLPWSFIEAVKTNKDFKFDKDSIFHMRNLSTGAVVEGCTVPPLISLYGLVFYQATLRKANEAIATEHMTPLRVLFPAPSSANADPVVSMSMRNFVGHMTDAMMKHKRDLNHVLVSPTAVGFQAVGGDGKSLLVSQEIEQAEESILLALGVSRELLSGQTNWTSSTVGLRLLENTLSSYVIQITELINWIMRKVTSYLNIETVPVSLIPFKLSDDDTVKQLLVTMMTSPNGAPSPASTTTVMETMGLDYKEELKKTKEDAVAKAINDIETKYEADEASYMAAKDIENRLNRNTDYQTMLAQAQQIATQLLKEEPEMMLEALNQIKLQSYPLYVMIIKLVEEQQLSMTSLNEQQVQSNAANPEMQGGPPGSGGAGGSKDKSKGGGESKEGIDPAAGESE